MVDLPDPIKPTSKILRMGEVVAGGESIRQTLNKMEKDAIRKIHKIDLYALRECVLSSGYELS